MKFRKLPYRLSLILMKMTNKSQVQLIIHLSRKYVKMIHWYVIDENYRHQVNQIKLMVELILSFFLFSTLDLYLDGNLPPATGSARQRRREQRFQPTTSPKEEENNPPPATPPVYDRSISNDSQIDAVEQERKAKRDMKDFLYQLDATLRLPASASVSSTLTEIPLQCDRTMMSTSNLEERRDALKEACLREMSVKDLNRVLEILDRVSETEIKERMIEILGEDIYEKCSAQIYGLKYYENSIFTRQ